jgi:hypothetical protein
MVESDETASSTKPAHRSHAAVRIPFSPAHFLIALLKEHIMFNQLTHRLGTLFTSSRESEREAWLASSTDLADLERRQRMLDDTSYPFHMHSSLAPRDWIA